VPATSKIFLLPSSGAAEDRAPEPRLVVLAFARFPSGAQSERREVKSPLPSRMRPYGPSRFVGREAERDALIRAVTVAGAGERQAVFVTGEPGIGKTRLVSEVAAQVYGSGALVLAGRCDEALGLSYQPFVEALELLVEHAPRELLTEHIRQYGDSVARLVPALGRRVIEPTPRAAHAGEAERYVLFAAVEGLLSAPGASPLVLVLEDLQWADAQTLLLVRRLITSPRPSPMIVISTCRLGQLAKAHPVRELLADLHREPGVTRVDLEGLAAGEVGELIQAIAELPAAGAGHELAEALCSGTGGNPFFVIELVRSLAETGTLVQHDGRWWVAGDLDLSSRLPRSITETLERRVGLLGAETGACLRTAAVAGYEFDLDLVAAVSDLGSVADHIEVAVTGGLLVEVDPTGARYRFAHALIRDWLYGEIAVARRVEIHRRIATALERRLAGGGVSVAELAGHWLAAARSADAEKALRYAALAGDEALIRLAPDEARRWYTTALELLAQQRDADEHDRCDLLVRRGEAERNAGELEFRETLLEASRLAQEIDDGDGLVRAALANTRGLQSASGIVDAERIAVLGSALDSVGDEDSLERAQLLATQAVELAFSGEWERRSKLSDEALAIARRLDDIAALSTVLNLRFLTVWAPETHTERLFNTADAVQLAVAAGDPMAEFYAYHWRVAVCIEDADIAQAREFAIRERQVADRFRLPTALWLAACDEANLAMIDGRLEEADALALVAFQAGQESEPDALACYTAQLSYLYFEQGRLGGLVGLLEQVVKDNPGIPGFRSTLALALCDEQRYEHAREVVAIDAAAGFSGLAYDVTWLSVACIYAHAAAQLGDAGACASLYELLSPWQGLVAYPGFGAWGSVSHYLGALAVALGEMTAAERHLSDAAACNRRMGASVWAARTGLQTARLHRARGQRDESRRRLAEVLAVAEKHGCPTIAREAGELLASL
jgi:hypothetical protein